MQDAADMELLRQYAEHDSEEAFTTLVKRHVNLVYSTALRHVGRSHPAEEITQAVFVILARKARSLRQGTVLSGWLYHAARLTAANFLRSEIQRTHREQEAYMQSTLNESETDAWMQISPLLDTAMAGLNERDRNAIALRFFEGRNMREVGSALGASEEAAKKRVSRALEKLRRFFTRRGITLSAAAIAGAVSANSVQAAPFGLVISAVAAAKGSAMTASTLTLIKGALKVMAWTKAKTAIVVGTGVLLAAGTATVTVREVQRHKTFSWQVEGFNGMVLEKAPPQVAILPSNVRYGSSGAMRDKKMGTGLPAQSVVQAAYSFQSGKRTILLADLPEGRFDYIASLANGNDEALQREVSRQFGVTAKREMREMDVLALRVRNSHAPGLKRGKGQGAGGTSNSGPGRYSVVNQPVSSVISYLEFYFQVPVVDQTHLTGTFDINLQWNESDERKRNPDAFKQILLDQLGFELVPTRESIEVLVVEKPK